MIPIEELKMYLGVDLKVKYLFTANEEKYTDIVKMKEVNTLSDNNILIGYPGATVSLSHCKPIVRPLSDLSKEIEYNGEKFIPLKKFADIEFSNCGDISDYKFGVADNFPLTGDYYIEFKNNGDIYQLIYSTFIDSFVFCNISTGTGITPCLYNKCMKNKLIEWHFDIFGWINKELAI